MENSKIEWTTHTFNPWIGCTKVSPGCTHCYAERRDIRLHQGSHWGPSGVRQITSEEYWRQPLRWNREAAADGSRTRVFCASLADVFEDRPELVEPRQRLFRLIQATQNLDWLLLTKRPENIMRLSEVYRGHDPEVHTWPSNIWMGTTVESTAYLGRIDHLRQVPAPIRFLSIEPMLDFDELIDAGFRPDFTGVDWVIIGGESGPKARPFFLSEALLLVQYIRTNFPHIKLFFKQLGDRPVDVLLRDIVTISHHGTDLAEVPEDLRIREFPR